MTEKNTKNGIWPHNQSMIKRIWINEELQVMYRKPNTVTIIKVRLEWAGHLVSMSDDRTIKKVFLGKPDRRQKTGNEN